MKKVLSLVLVLTLVLGSFAFAAPASDVVGTEFEDAVDTLNVLGILKGYEDGTFKPGNSITRAEFAAVVVRALGQEQVAGLANTATKFNDVQSGQWFAGYVNVAANLKVVNGYPDGSFKPQAAVTYEEAVTMIMRALGYEPEATQKGGYPIGYLLVAGDAGVTFNVNGVMKAPASRGVVAQLVNNALTAPMMVPVEFGNGVTYVKAGENGTDYKDLLTNFLGGTLIQSTRTEDVRLEDFERYGTREGYVKIGGKTYKLEKFAKDADLESLFGLKVKAWVNGYGDVLRIQADDEAVLGGIYDVDDGVVTMHVTYDEYDLAKSPLVYINGEKAKASDLEGNAYTYAKLALNREGDVAFVEAFTWNDYVVVEEVDGNVVYGYGEDLNAKDYTIVKDSKTITLDDLEEDDILFYRSDAKFAEVYNNSVTGEIGRIYVDRVDIGGTVRGFGSTKYLNEKGQIGSISTNYKDVLETMKDAGEVTAFLNRAGVMVYLTGDVSDLKTTSSYYVLYNNATYYETRNVGKVALDVVDSEGNKVNLDALVNYAELVEVNGTVTPWVTTPGAAQAGLAQGTVIAIELDKNGEVTEVQKVASTSLGLSESIKVDARYYNGKRLNSNTVVFLAEAFDSSFKPVDLVVDTFGELDFDYINDADVYTDSNDNVVAIYVTASTRQTATTYRTVSVAAPNKDAGKNIYRLRLIIDGARNYFFTKENPTTNMANIVTEAPLGTFLEVGMNKDNTEILTVNKIADNDATRVVAGKVTAISVSNGTISIDGTSLILGESATVVASSTANTILFSELKVGDDVKALRVSNSSRYVDVIYRVAAASAPSPLTDEQKAQAVMDLIDALDPSAGNFATKVTEARAAFNALTLVQQGLVPTAYKNALATAEGLVSDKAVADVEVLINALNLATPVEADVTAARAAYNALGALKFEVNAAVLAKLVQAENQLAVNAVAAGIANTFEATGAANAVIMPTAPTGYEIAVKTTSDPAVYSANGEILTTGTANVVYTVTHTASSLTADTVSVAVTVTVQ